MIRTEPDRLDARVRPVGDALLHTLSKLLDAFPGSPLSPTALARRLGLSRVILSRIVNAVDRADPFDALQQLPGPESLRRLAHAAREQEVADRLIHDAERAIDEFATLIREEFGTRSALSAAISPQRPELHRRFEHASRYQVHKGMAEVLGVEAETWLTSMIFAPSATDPDAVDVTTVHGALGVRRLRRDVSVYFTFGPPDQALGTSSGVSQSPIALQEFYANEPAPLESSMASGQLVHRLAHDRLGRAATVDMLAAGRNSAGSRRYASTDRRYSGVIVFPDIPVRTLIADALVHDSVFPDAEPRVFVYNPGAKGPANPNDPRRDIDRLVVPETAEHLAKSQSRFEVPEIPNYGPMMQRVFTDTGHDPSEFRLFRLRMHYPVHGFQIVLAFPTPDRPI